jgi:hypothetical protein
MDPEITALQQQVLTLRRAVQRHEEWIDLLSSPLYKRVWFVLRGWRWKRLGRLTEAPWPPPAERWWR